MCLVVDLYIWFHQLMDEESKMKVRVLTNLNQSNSRRKPVWASSPPLLKVLGLVIVVDL